MNHYNAVGFDASDREAFRGTVSSLAVLGEREDASLGTRLLWADPSGAAIAVFVRDMSIVCAKPMFAAGSRLLVRPVGTTPKFWLIGRRLDTPATTHRRRFLRPRQP